MQCSTCNVKNAGIYNYGQITTEPPRGRGAARSFQDSALPNNFVDFGDSALLNNFVVASNTWCSRHNNGDPNCSLCVRNPNVFR